MALVAAVLTKPRGGKFNAMGQPCRLEKQSPALNVLGGLILWAGWFFFNASGVRSFSEQPDTVSIALPPRWFCFACIPAAAMLIARKNGTLDCLLMLSSRQP